MSKLRAKNIELATGTTLTLGASGDAIAVSSDSVQANTWQDTGGNSLFVSDGSGTLSSVNSGLSGGGYTLIGSAHTASNAASIDITSGIDSTYEEYIFVLTDMNPATDNVDLEFQVQLTSGTSYNTSISSIFFNAYHDEAGSSSALTFESTKSQGTGTAYQPISYNTGNAGDELSAGILHLFSPANTTYIKHFYGKFNCTGSSTQSQNAYFAGYINDTNDVDAIDFKMSSGNFDGTIKMYGISKS